MRRTIHPLTTPRTIKPTTPMYESLQLPWSPHPTPSESLYRSASLTKTRGTLFILPPPPSILTSTFNAPPRPRTRMSSGAVALCKHVERGGPGVSSEHNLPHPFWPRPVGGNEEKSKIAAGVLEEMSSGAEWRNVLFLHQGVAVYEVRNAKGYGMRWTLEVEEKEGRGKSREEEDDGAQSEEVSDERRSGGDQDRDTMVDQANAKEWVVTKTTFRGFLEPIEKLDHELPDR